MGALVLPGQAVIPKNYGESIVLFSTEGFECVIDGAPVGQHGRLYKIPAGKAIKVPFEVGRYLLDTQSFPFIDVVRVHEEEQESGIVYDIDGAKADSLARLVQADDLAFKQYVQGAVEDFVKRNKPVPQPPDKIIRIMERRGFKLEQYGIVPIGWKTAENKQLTAVSDENATLKQQLASQQDQMAEMQKKLDALLVANVSGDSKKKG